MICSIGDLDNPDMIGEVADLLLRHEAVDWVMCYGFFENQMLISFRTQDNRLDAGDIARKVVYKLGTGGGHASMAGGQIPLRKGKRTLVERLIRSRFLKSLKIKTRKPLSLVSSAGKG
jgi:nanoRNase/pAp phosphatase (c-di-AMP/oligoRNAs hydrolase)